MHDLTQGSITQNVVKMALPIFFGMLFQVAYFLIDLYFVSRLGQASIAGVNAAGNLNFIVMALTQVLGVGTTTLIAQAVGRKDQADANLVFNQSIAIAVLASVFTAVGGWLVIEPYMAALGSDPEMRVAGRDYLLWCLPGLALQFAINAMGSALRGTGIAKPTMIVQMLTVIVNAILAPVLIAGWGTGHPLGVAGAGLATSIAVVFGTLLLLGYFLKLEHYVSFDLTQWAPRLSVWARMLRIGLPAGGEFALMFIYMAVIYLAIRDFGVAAQAGFSIGQQVMRAIFLPAMAVAFATAPVAAQNVGARLFDRVRETFRVSVVISSVIMLLLTLLLEIAPAALVRPWTDSAEVTAVGTEFLRYIAWNFVAQGVVFTCSGMFQALGNTVPALLSSATRLITFSLPVIWLAQHPGFQLHHVWIVSILSVTLQMVFSLWLLRGQFRQRLQLAPAAAAAAA
jgi:putative MATE family efflux protein